MAQAYLQGLHYGSELHPRTPLTDTESDGHLHHSHSHQQQEHERTFPCPLQDLLLPAAAAADAAAVPEGVEMREVGGQLLQGDAQQMAQVRCCLLPWVLVDKTVTSLCLLLEQRPL